ncbi:MAG: cytidylate kinase family protein, partial [Spirochaetaceae bacterium]|nr:cytidylate kinase family protein [Spirochaetaceae bacterium]
YDIPERDAARIIAQTNKFRSNHYNIFTESTWGARENYDLLINSALAGIDGTAEIIANLAK